MKATLLGGLIGFALTAGVFATRVLPKYLDDEEMRRVLVATRDLPAGTIFGLEHVERVELDSDYLTASVIEAADLEALVGMPLSGEVKKGDVLLWSLFADRARERAIRECGEAIAPVVQQAGDAAADMVIARFSRSLQPSTSETAEPSPSTNSARVELLIATSTITEASTIEPRQLGVRSMPREWVTDSMVRAADRDRIVGVRAALPLEPGDVVLWQQLDRESAPGSSSCASAARQARAEARKATAAQEAPRYFARRAEEGR